MIKGAAEGRRSVSVVQARRAWVGGRFVSNVVVKMSGKTIVSVRAGDERLIQGAMQADTLLPGLINAHCHLEYSHLRGQLPRGNVSFGEWMGAIMKVRMAGDEVINAGMRRGAGELLRGGCTFVVDSTTDGASAAVLEEADLGYSLFYEVLGLTEERGREQWLRALTLIESRVGAQHGVGINPHAPYSVGEWLRNRVREVGDDPVAWHLAESADESELFQSGKGSIADLFRRYGLPMPWGNGPVPGCSPFQFLRKESLLEKLQLGFHCNTLSTDEAQFFKGERAIVHCPGTHRWFARERFPLRELLDAGVRVCLGTDSLASSDSLSMLQMMRIVAEDHPDVNEAEVIGMATTTPGEIGIIKSAGMRGKIAEGYLADLCLVYGEWPDIKLDALIRNGTVVVMNGLE